MEKYFDLMMPILIDAILTLVTITAVVGILIGLWLLIHPQSFAKFEALLSQTYSLRRQLRPLEISRNLDRHIYRHHKAVGLLIILASTYTLYRLLFDILPEPPIDSPSIKVSTAIIDWLLSSLDFFLLIGNLFTVIIGFIVFSRPSLLKDFEYRANRWLSVRQKTRWMDSDIDFPDRLAQTKPRLMGVSLLILCIYFLTIITRT